MLTVAAAERPMAYGELSEATGQMHRTTQIQAALLSDGRGKQRGMNLLVRVQGDDRRLKLLTTSPSGDAIARQFLADEKDAELESSYKNELSAKVLPALGHVLGMAPEIKLGTFCVLLYIVERNPEFALDGLPSVTITNDLGISNLPRHIAVLSSGGKTGKDLGLVEMISDRGPDKRVVVPSLTGKGLQLMANVAAALQQKRPDPVKTPKPERLADDATHADVNAFGDDDWNFDEIEWMGSEDDDEPAQT